MEKRVLNLNSRMIIIIISFLFIFAFTACTLQGGKGTIRLLSRDEIQEVEEDVIALVNGEKVYKEEFNQYYDVMDATGLYEDPNELKVIVLEILIDSKVEEQKIIELGITVSDEEARELYHKAFEDKDSSFEDFIENSPGLEESDFLNVTKEAIKIDKLYEMNTIIGEEDLEPEEAMEAKTKYLNTLIKEAEIGVQEEYFDLVPKDYEVDKLKVKNY